MKEYWGIQQGKRTDLVQNGRSFGDIAKQSRIRKDNAALIKLNDLIQLLKSRIAQFLKEYWGVNQGTRKELGQNGLTDIAETIGETERTTKRSNQSKGQNTFENNNSGNRKSRLQAHGMMTEDDSLNQ